LNTDFGSKNEKQDCEIGSVCGEVIVGGEKVSGGGEGICLMDVVYIHEIE
jgi:hypothetical protein